MTLFAGIGLALLYALIGAFIFWQNRKMGDAITGTILAMFWFIVPILWIIGKISVYIDELDEPRDRHGSIIYNTQPTPESKPKPKPKPKLEPKSKSKSKLKPKSKPGIRYDT